MEWLQNFVLYSFLSLPGTRNTRVIDAIVDTGSVTFASGLTFVLCILPMLAAVSTVAFQSCVLGASAVLAGQVMGVTVMPVLLSLIGPMQLVELHKLSDSEDLRLLGESLLYKVSSGSNALVYIQSTVLTAHEASAMSPNTPNEPISPPKYLLFSFPRAAWQASRSTRCKLRENAVNIRSISKVQQ
jgi:MMPL family